MEETGSSQILVQVVLGGRTLCTVEAIASRLEAIPTSNKKLLVAPAVLVLGGPRHVLMRL